LAVNFLLRDEDSVTIAYSEWSHQQRDSDSEGYEAPDDVYQPQEDSLLLIEAMASLDLARGRRVADLCTGSGVIAIAAAEAGAKSVLAVDICPRAVLTARTNALLARVQLHTVLGSWARSREFGPFDVVLCNPPYVPEADAIADPQPSSISAPPLSYNGGPSGRLVLDPLCEAAPELLDQAGTILIVQSEFADPDRTIDLLRANGLRAAVAATQTIDFGPVLHSRAAWLESSGRLKPGVRVEKLVVIRGDKR
jgi:release factor glutamine methyltransferase